MEAKKTQLNYLYFGLFFLTLVLLAAGGIFTKESLGGSRLFFFLYAVGQAFLEILFFAFLSLLIRRFLGPFCFFAFIGLTFIAFFFHLFDFLMERILDQTVWETLSIFVFQESFENFIYLLDASGISLWAWGIFFALLTSLPFLGVYLYKLSETISLKRPLLVHHSLYMQMFCCVPVALFFWDFSASKVIEPDTYFAFVKSLPWKVTFLRPKYTHIALNGSLKKPEMPSLDEYVVLEQKPNIYLFVTESLREDAITPEIAPHLSQFRDQHIHFETALSNGNGTHLSWFSIFYSQFSWFWKHIQSSWPHGSPPLQILKNWGYKIRLYSSANLGYYGMEEVLFGHKAHLIDSYETFHHAPPLSAADSDAAALAKLQQDLRDHPDLREGQIFIIFWDCTHFDYNWPKNWTPKFQPFAKEFAYFQAFHSKKTIGEIKNRYWNAINYMDSLFGNFLEHLENKDQAIVIFTGDHGEEFFEHGHLFHNSHLTQEQTNIPLYMKFGSHSEFLLKPLGTQMDIFPSIFDYLARRVPKELEGQSVFQEMSWPYAITSRFNAGGAPYEFSIHNGKHKLIAQFSPSGEIFHAKELKILSLKTTKDKTVPEFKKNFDLWIDKEFGPAFNRIFPQAPGEGH